MSARFHTRRVGRGQSLVEFALVLPLLIVVMVAIFDLGRAVFVYNAVSNAAREGVRLAIVDQGAAGIMAEASAHSIGNVPAVPCSGGSPSCVSVRFLNPDLSGGAPCDAVPVPTGCIAEVRVDYRFDPLTPVGLLSIFAQATGQPPLGSITISSSSRLQVEHSS
jgi:hypothetical protein